MEWLPSLRAIVILPSYWRFFRLHIGPAPRGTVDLLSIQHKKWLASMRAIFPAAIRNGAN